MQGAPPQSNTVPRFHQPIVQRNGDALIFDNGTFDSLCRGSQGLKPMENQRSLRRWGQPCHVSACFEAGESMMSHVSHLL